MAVVARAPQRGHRARRHRRAHVQGRRRSVALDLVRSRAGGPCDRDHHERRYQWSAELHHRFGHCARTSWPRATPTGFAAVSMFTSKPSGFARIELARSVVIATFCLVNEPLPFGNVTDFMSMTSVGD